MYTRFGAPLRDELVTEVTDGNACARLILPLPAANRDAVRERFSTRR
jgi:hypothetical protein